MKVKFIGRNQTGFFAAVKTEVNDYFKTRGISKNWNWEMALKSILFLGLLISLYGIIISNIFGIYTMMGLAIILGMVMSLIGFNVCHDAIHGSYSSSRKTNKIFSMIFNVLGANAYMWDIIHNKVHHTYTNIPGHDEDIEVAPGLVKLNPMDKRTAIMKFQHIYAFFLYGFTSLSWVFQKDFKKFFQKKIGETDNTNHPRIEYFNLFFYKILYYVIFIAIPIIVLDITWWQFLIGFFIMHFAEGLTLGLVFQLAHVVEGPEFPEPDVEGSIEEVWAVFQMKTTANFARRSRVVTFFCGGLNYQIEHHLFPNICHIHYPIISKIVKATAQKFDVPYHENRTFFGAIKSHYKMLKKFGSADFQPHPVPA